jgi:hypothetical protein
MRRQNQWANEHEEMFQKQNLLAVFPSIFSMMKSHMQSCHPCMAHRLSDVNSHTKNQQSMLKLMWARSWFQSQLQLQKAAILQHFPCYTTHIWLHTSSPCMLCSNVPLGPVTSPSLISSLMSRHLSSLTQHRHHIEKARYKLMMHPNHLPVKVTTRLL